jgi:hypothetical protein
VQYSTYTIFCIKASNGIVMAPDAFAKIGAFHEPGLGPITHLVAHAA